jgi:hypothetical protein
MASTALDRRMQAVTFGFTHSIVIHDAQLDLVPIG